MLDSIHVSLAVVNVGLSLLTLLFAIYGIRHFKTGLLVRTLKRAIPMAILLALYFSTVALVAMNALPANTPIDDILGTLFMLSFLYLAYGFVHDWTHLENYK
jgi:Na+/H+ antiporter NhaB